MTIREIYEYTLIELNKVKINTLLLDQFVYCYNKAVIQYCNKSYNLAEVNQQYSDNLRLLKDTIEFTPTKINNKNGIYNGIYEEILHINYFHILNCIIEYEELNSDNICDNEDGKFIHIPARRLTANLWGNINQNYYMQPKYINPYFYIFLYYIL